MRLFALIGKSGTGKSYQAMFVAKRENIECIIDDGLLISNNKIIAGTSAKKEHTKIASVKHAIFLDNKYTSEMKHAIKNFNPSSILILYGRISLKIITNNYFLWHFTSCFKMVFGFSMIFLKVS